MYVAYRTQVDELEEQLLFRRCRIGRSAAREIAQRIEGQHGFWDIDMRKALESWKAAPTGSIAVVDAEAHDGVSHQFLAGQQLSGEEAPTRAA